MQLDEQLIKEDVQRLPWPWFGLSHTFENRDRAFRLDKVMAFTADYNREEVKVWVHLEGESKPYEVMMTFKGYDEFLESIKKHPIDLSEGGPGPGGTSVGFAAPLGDEEKSCR